MKIIDIINHRHSYRGKYKPISVPREDLITIMQAVSIVYTECVEYDSKDCLLASHTRIYETLIKGDEKDFNDAIDFHYDLIEKRV